MKKFLIRLSVFAVIMLALQSAVCMMMTGVISHAKGQTARKMYTADSLAEDIIVMGSSRALHHYNSLILEDSLGLSCYNCGEDKMGIVYCYGQYQMIRHHKKPKVIIYDVEPDYDLLSNDNITYLSPLKIFYDRPGVDYVFGLVDPNEQIKMKLGIYKYNSILLDVVKDVVSTKTFSKGFDPYKGIDPHGFVPEDLKQDSFDTLKCELLKKFIRQTRTDKVKLIFMASPQLSYASDSVFKGFTMMCKKEGIPFFNHFCDSQYTMRKKLFHNCNHFNEQGADLYTKNVVSEIKRFLNKER